MGGGGSGNFRDVTKTPIAACLALDLRQLVWLGAVQPGARRRGIIHWPAVSGHAYDCTIAYVSDLREAPWLRLIYSVKHLEQADHPIEQIESVVHLTTTSLHFGGGGRWWWRCPLVRNGQTCAKRAQTLYLPPLEGARFRFSCTHCHGLTYSSRQSRWPTWQRAWPAITVQDVDRTEARVLGALRRKPQRRREEQKTERAP